MHMSASAHAMGKKLTVTERILGIKPQSEQHRQCAPKKLEFGSAEWQQREKENPRRPRFLIPMGPGISVVA